MPDSEHRARAIDDLVELMPELNRLEARAAAILPTELYAEVVRVNRTLGDFLEAIDKEIDTQHLVDAFTAHTAKGALLSRIFLGVDELSQESVKLFAKSEDVDRVSEIPHDQILALRKKNPS